MCGIAGFSISDLDHKVINSRHLAKMLLRQSMSRGKDATGAVWSESFEGRTELFFSKSPVDAEDFIQKDLDLIPKFTRTALLHTRWATQGDPSDNNNNHPINASGIIGVHNGHISNDDEIFEYFDADRIAEVDSEAIFQLIGHSDNPLKDFCLLEGRAAFAWYEVEDSSTMYVVRLAGSPLWVGQTKNKSLIFASTQEILMRAVNQANLSLSKIWQVAEQTFFKVVKGEVVECVSLDKMEAVEPNFVRIGDKFIFDSNRAHKAEKSSSVRTNMDRLYGYTSPYGKR